MATTALQFVPLKKKSLSALWSRLSNIVHLRTVRSQMHRVSRCDSFDSNNKGPLWPSRELPSMI